MAAQLFNLGVSYLAGLLTFFAGCLAPVAPIYVSFLAGSGSQKNKRFAFSKNALSFTLGFIFVFLLLGFTINSLARSLIIYRSLIQRLAGLIIVFLGLVYLDAVRIPFLQHTYTKRIKQSSSSPYTSFLLGLIFSFAWTPCVSPVLAAILFWVAVMPNYVRGIPLLLMFALGLATPFILLGLTMDKLAPLYKKINTKSALIKRAAGIALILFGLLYFLNSYAFISTHLLPGLEERMSILTLDVD